MPNDFAAEWIVLCTSAIKRLNIVVGALVSHTYLEKMSYIGYDTYSIMNTLFDEFEKNELSWSWRMLRLDEPYALYLFKGIVPHHIRIRQRQSLHYEVWIYGLFLCCDGRYRLAPLKRDSDFVSDIVQKLSKSIVKARLPWEKSQTIL